MNEGPVRWPRWTEEEVEWVGSSTVITSMRRLRSCGSSCGTRRAGLNGRSESSRSRTWSDQLDRVGGRWTEVRRGPFGISQEGTVVVTKVEPLKSFEVQREGEGEDSRVTHTVTPENGGTRKTTESLFKFPGGFLGRIAERLFAVGFIERHSNRCEENVKALAEGRYPPHPTPAVERNLVTPRPVQRDDTLQPTAPEEGKPHA